MSSSARAAAYESEFFGEDFAAAPVSDFGDQGASADPLAGTTAPNGKPIWSLSQIVSNVSGLLRWNEAWPQNDTILYSFLTALPPFTSSSYSFVSFTEIEKTFTRAAFALVSDIVPLTFIETPWDGRSFNASESIVLGANASAEDFEWGHARNGTFNRPGVDQIDNAEIWISPEAVAVRQWIYGGYNFKSLIHEILHTLGLPHPGDYNADGNPITYAANAAYFQDSAQYTVMSYFDATNTGADYTLEVQPGLSSTAGIYSPSTPMVHDIAALQALYGANMTTRSGDTVYGYNSTAGRPSYDVTLASAPVFTIWDGGGIDTLDISGSGVSAIIDLNEGAYSTAFTMTNNIGIAYGAQIENAKGGSAADILLGNALANRLEGGAGADQLTGGGGDDVLIGGADGDFAVYGANAINFAWWSNSNGTWTVQDLRAGRPAGTDNLIEVEQLKFADRDVRILGLTITESIQSAFENVLWHGPRNTSDLNYISTLASQVSSGLMTLQGAVESIVTRADATTSVASLAYQFFLGFAPSKGGFDYLVSPAGPNPNNINSAYYQSFSVENRYINFTVNLGAGGEGRAAFQAEYGGKTLFEATRSAYAEIFGLTPDDAKLHEILDPMVGLAGTAMTRAQYFAVYGGDGLEGLGTKAAMVGWLLAEAEKGNIGTYALSNHAYLTDLADGAPFLVDLIGAYSQPGFALGA